MHKGTDFNEMGFEMSEREFAKGNSDREQSSDFTPLPTTSSSDLDVTDLLDALEHNPMSLVNEVDWITKLSVLNGYRNRDQLLWNDSRLAAIDIQFADLRPDKGLARVLQQKGKMDLMFTEEQVAKAVASPPIDTRAYFRGTCVSKFVDQVAAASWDSVILDLGPDVPLKRISTPDALGGTQEAALDLFERSQLAGDLLANLKPEHVLA